MPLYIVTAKDARFDDTFHAYVDARDPIDGVKTFKENVEAEFFVPLTHVEIQDIQVFPEPRHDGRILPMSDTEAIYSVKEEALEKVSNYAVIGRSYGDDEASVEIYNGTTRSEAIAKFTKGYAPDEIPETTRFLEGKEFSGVYIDAVIQSDAAIVED